VVLPAAHHTGGGEVPKVCTHGGRHPARIVIFWTPTPLQQLGIPVAMIVLVEEGGRIVLPLVSY